MVTPVYRLGVLSSGYPSIQIRSFVFVLSERVSQDSIENYFAQQRARGGRNDNPTFEQCLKNAGALCLQKSMALDPVRGNCSRKRRPQYTD